MDTIITLTEVSSHPIAKCVSTVGYSRKCLSFCASSREDIARFAF